MVGAAAALMASLMVTALVVAWADRRPAHPVLSDSDLSGPQKFHTRPVPRVGGIGVAAGCLIGLLLWASSMPSPGLSAPVLLLCASIAFGAGLLEDLTKRVSVRHRLGATLLAGVLAAWLLGAVVTRTGLPGFDWLVSHPAGAWIVAVLVIAGASNSVNIIDGFNGLASMCVMLMLAGLAAVAGLSGDAELLSWALIGIGSVLGFFLWNYPHGRIFLGDGGAYLLGFLVAVIGILLLVRQPEVSPLSPLLMVTYPGFETLFSIYRRVLLRGRSAGSPDAVHLHTLVFRRLVSCGRSRRHHPTRDRRNAMTSPYLWGLCALTVAPAVVFWQNTLVLFVFMLGFLALYVWLYWRIVRFRTPRWMTLARRRPLLIAALNPRVVEGAGERQE